MRHLSWILNTTLQILRLSPAPSEMRLIRDQYSTGEERPGPNDGKYFYTTRYTTRYQPLSRFAINAHIAYQAKLISLANGAIYILKNSDLKKEDLSARCQKIQQLIQNKINALDELQKMGQSISFHDDFAHFYHTALPETAGLPIEKIKLGEAFYVWQYQSLPSRKTEMLLEFDDKDEPKTLNSRLLKEAALTIEQADYPLPVVLIREKDAFSRIHGEIKDQPTWLV